MDKTNEIQYIMYYKYPYFFSWEEVWAQESIRTPNNEDAAVMDYFPEKPDTRKGMQDSIVTEYGRKEHWCKCDTQLNSTPIAENF